MTKGFVYLVGAGPGRADLITVRGAEILKKADCIIYDKLANPALLKYAQADTEIIHVPKRIGKSSATQEQINRLLLDKASSGLTVVRLKGGDPCIFGRAAEELTVLVEGGIDFEIVPGVTAGIAVSSYTGIILTDREYSSQVVFITGREAEGKQDGNIDWELLTKFKGTLVFYMGVGNLGTIADKLIEKGLSPNTPAAVVANITFPTQKIVKANLENVQQDCKEQNIEPPAIIIVGQAAQSDVNFDWFTKLPLFGKSILITRDEPGNTELAEKIICRGGNPVAFETFKIKPMTESNDFLQTLTKFHEYDWIVFTSRNGVTIFFEALRKLNKDARVFASAKIACIGTKTASMLNQYGIKADFIPSVYTSEEFGRQLIKFTNIKDKKVLLLRSQLASNELVETLTQAGAKVEDVAIYTAVMQKGESALLEEKIQNNEVDWVTFASPSAVNAFFEQINAELINSSKVKVASIGPVTSIELEHRGVNIDVTADEHTLDGLLNAIENFYW